MISLGEKPGKVTRAQYSRHSGLSAGRITRLVQMGMPLSSRADADQWRADNIGRRHIKLRRGFKAPGVPNPAKSQPTSPTVARDPPKASESDTVVTEDSVRGAFERQRQLEREAYKLATESVRGNDFNAAKLVTVHGAAVTNLARSRAEVLALEQREGQLVDASWVRRVMTEHDGAVVALIRQMPKTLAGRIAPHDPAHAEAELTRWVDESFLRMLHATDPWKEKETA